MDADNAIADKVQSQIPLKSEVNTAAEDEEVSEVYEEYVENNIDASVDDTNANKSEIINTFILNDVEYTELTYDEEDESEQIASTIDNDDTTYDTEKFSQLSEENPLAEDGDEEVFVEDSEFITIENVTASDEEADEDRKFTTAIVEKRHHCTKCSRTFNTTAGLKRHQTVSHANDDDDVKDPLAFQLCLCCGEPVDSAHTIGDFKCDQCDKLFLHEGSRNRHCSIEHNTLDYYQCIECKKEFRTKEKLIQHIQSHPVLNPFTCRHCGQEFSQRFHFERHRFVSGCGGAPIKKILTCKVCNEDFDSKSKMNEHLLSHGAQPKRKKIFTCAYCQKEFQGAALLNIHTRTHTGEKPYQCDLCEKRFPSSGAMKKHRRMHTGERPYQCSKCNNRFAAKETLNRHMRIHTGNKPHTCKFCGKSFIQASQLRAHIFHHTGEHAYICPHCNRAFNRRLRLTTHIKYLHEGCTPLNCPHCDKKFFRKEDLARHSVRHTGEKPYKCEVCHKGFAIKSSVRIHMLTHRREPPCSCERCGRAFIRQDCLMRHMRARHRDVLEDIMASAEKKRLQQQLLNAANAAIIKNEGVPNDSVVWSELTLSESIRELLTILVDEECLQEFGFPDVPVDKVLDGVIRRCGHTPASEEDFDYIGRMRENAKLLFTVVIDDEAVKALLNNQTVDEVILHVLRLAKLDDGEENGEAEDVSNQI